ncbi:TetR/AcrR family transcriptional regulator [Streptomyces sp. NBC_00690]|uniref:TetR/AcrR family transcriptional regulator n=1 Tax=Streptomyces sp. NBC_00690 TaxID=2975808 RepID=UPI002E2D9C8A|nr:TetR/AcrR family transcriptional regulator [Streptomyces sp. NBC_00690]
MATRTRLTPEREAELYEAVLDLLAEVGYDALTMDAIAARTRSSKATLYRQWRSKPELVAKALQETKPPGLDEIDTGSLRGDFYEILARTDDSKLERDSALLRGLVQAVHHNPDLHEALREQLVEPEKRELDAVVRRAVGRGEISAANPAVEFVAHMLVGAFFARLIIDDQHPDKAYIMRYIDAVVLPALGV